MPAKHFLCFNNRIYGEGLVPEKCIQAPLHHSGLGCCLGGGFIFDSLFIVSPIFCVVSVFDTCFVMCDT